MTATMLKEGTPTRTAEILPAKRLKWAAAFYLRQQ